MKFPIGFKILTAVLLLMLAKKLWAGVLVLPATTVNGTVYGPTNTIAGGTIPLTTFNVITPQITNAPIYVTNVVSGVTNVVNVITNCTGVNWQFSLDGTNFTTVSKYNPSGTNQTVDSFTPATTGLTIYYRAQVVTTNQLPYAITTR